MICIFGSFLLALLVTYTISFTSWFIQLEKIQLFDRFSPEDKRNSSRRRVPPHL